MRTTLVVLIAAAACGGDDMQPPPSAVVGPLQMNDLSVMLPLPQRQSEADVMLQPTAAARGGQLLPEAVFDSAGGFSAYTSLRAIAFRVDPCFGQLGPVTDPAMCHAQLRIVFQPISFGGTDGTVSTFIDDAGVHAFYALTNDELLSIVDELAQARADAAGSADLGPLAPHPTLVRDGLDGTLGTAFVAILVKYAGAANMVRMTQFNLDPPDIAPSPKVAPVTGGMPEFSGFWAFASFDVANGSATPRDVPTLPAGAGNSMSVEGGVLPLMARTSPVSTSPDSLAALDDMTGSGSASAAQLQAAFDAALRIQNPGFHSPDTIDCGSCHLAGPAIDLVGTPLGLSATGNANAFSASLDIPAADLAHTTVLDSDGELNLHAFSYLQTAPTINQRVINETAANLAYINSLR